MVGGGGGGGVNVGRSGGGGSLGPFLRSANAGVRYYSEEVRFIRTQWNPDFSNLLGKQKLVQKIGSSKNRGFQNQDSTVLSKTLIRVACGRTFSLLFRVKQKKIGDVCTQAMIRVLFPFHFNFFL